MQRRTKRKRLEDEYLNEEESEYDDDDEYEEPKRKKRLRKVRTTTCERLTWLVYSSCFLCVVVFEAHQDRGRREGADAASMTSLVLSPIGLRDCMCLVFISASPPQALAFQGREQVWIEGMSLVVVLE
jgi:hypothetical protein